MSSNTPFFVSQILEKWVDKEEIWPRLYKKGELFSLRNVSAQTGLEKQTIINATSNGFPIKKDGRFQHLCYIPENFVGCDSEETARTCLKQWFTNNGYQVYGSPRKEVSFRQTGLKAIYRLAQSRLTEDWNSLENCLGANGIDLVAFSPKTKEVWIVEVKGWTSTTSDFNEAVQQILRRLLDVYSLSQTLENIKFACAFPYFCAIQDWENKFNVIRKIRQSSHHLPSYFASATTVKKEEGMRFLSKFVDGPLDVARLIENDRLSFLLIKSATNVCNLTG